MTVPGAPPPPAVPPGTFRIDREGYWLHEGQEVTHPGILRNLFANLRVDGRGHYLRVGPLRIAVEVRDAPFVVTRIEPGDRTAGGARSLALLLSDGSQEPLALETLWVDARGVPRCRVRGGRFAARLSLAAWFQLAAFAEEEPETGRVVVVVGERRVRVGRGG